MFSSHQPIVDGHYGANVKEVLKKESSSGKKNAMAQIVERIVQTENQRNEHVQ